MYGVKEKFVCEGLYNGLEARIVSEGWFDREGGLGKGIICRQHCSTSVSGMVEELKDGMRVKMINVMVHLL